MKTYLSITTLLIALLFPIFGHADTFCVSDATGLQTALTTASGNGEDDTIQIEQGTYVGSFIYASTEAFSLAVEGGYTTGCSSRMVDPVNTVLDANETGSVLIISAHDTDANLEVDGLTLQNGVAGNSYGGAIYTNSGGIIIISNNTITGNSANSSGGGAFAEADHATIILTNNTITGNTANTSNGGGVFAASAYGTITLTNNTITGNTSDGHGGGVYSSLGGGGPITLTNNTITDNSANMNGGGFHVLLVQNGDVANVTNNIIWNNTSTNSGNDLYLNNDGNGDYFPSTVNLYNNDFDQSADGIYIELPFTIDPSNLDNEDPLFVDPPNDDYHLTSSSPCIDVGSLAEAPEDDIDGHSRPQGDGVDIGADEYIPPDADEDGVPNEEDNCPTDSNPDQTDTDYDCIGDECDDFPDEYDPTVPDSDGDGVGDACDVCPYDLNDDIDNDGLCANEDNCPDIPNGPELGTCVNTSSGGIGATCMNDGECSSGEVCNNNQEDRDNDGSGDACDNDMMCQGNFDFDNDVDGTDASLFKAHFGRSTFKNPCPPDGPAPAEQTGQFTSYATGDDGEHQSGVPFPEPRFVDNEDGTVKDNLTGLIWLKDANCFGQRAWADAISDCNGLASGQCGLTDGSHVGDWRLPNYKELISLIDVEEYNPALPSGHPFTNVRPGLYLSSSTFISYVGEAWGMHMSYGYVDGVSKLVSLYVWPVRGGH